MLIGALLACACFFLYLSKQEVYHFSRLVHSALGLPPDHDNRAPHTEQNVLLIMHKVHAVVDGRHRQVADVGHPEPGILWSSDEHLTEPSGACASYTQVLAKTLQTAGYPIRKVGLSKGDRRGIHHVLETKVEGHWAVLDGLSNLAFRRPDGHLASAADVHADWAHYRIQAPPDYNPDYDYSTFYYTNWSKVPVIGAVVLAITPLHAWLEARGVSLWFLLLDVNQWFAGLALTGAALLIALRLWVKFRRKRAQSQTGGRRLHTGYGHAGNRTRPLAGFSSV
jgi:hypothetical protein